MLKAFTARPVVDLKQRDKSKIETILAYGDRLLVGLNNGHLRVYRVNEAPEGTNGQAQDTGHDGQADSGPKQAKYVELLREEEKFSRKPIQQLAVIKEANILISLSDSYVTFYDLQTYALSERLDKTKGASSFAVMSNIFKDPESGIPCLVSRLAVAVKRKILIWTWRDMELTGDAEELSLFASIKCMIWSSGTQIVAGMDPGFVMIDVEKREIKDILRPPGPGEATHAAGTRFGAVNTSGMSVMGMGGWVPKPMVAKLADGQMLLAKDVNTLFIDADGKAIEKRQVPWAQAPEAIGYSYPYLLALQPPSRGTLELRNPETLSLLQKIDMPNASILHVPNPHISLAHAGKGFLVASDRCIWRMSAIGYSSQIDGLLEKKRYDEAMSLVNLLEDTLLLDKAARLREIRMQKAQWLFDGQKYREALDLFSAAQAPPARVISLYPPSIAGSLSVHDKDPNEELTQPESVLSGSHSDAGVSDITPPSAKGDTADRAKTKDNKLEGRDLVFAVNELRAFLAQTRVYLQKFINFDGTLKTGAVENKEAFEHVVSNRVAQKDIELQQQLLDTASLVDTTLFRSYMLVSPSLAGSLFRLDNFCSPQVVEDALYANGRYNELIDFLHGKRLHKDALEMLEKFGRGEAESTIDESFRGPSKTVRYLQQLPPELVDLIIRFSEWPIKVDPDLGMEVFLADSENAETLPRDKVLEFLDKIDQSLSLQYLEHIIDELDDQTPLFHDRLVSLVLERMKQSQEEEERARLQRKLETFLQNSKQYNKYRALRDLPEDDPTFYAARASVLYQLNRHNEALSIYVFQMRNYALAEDYCNNVYLSLLASAPTTTTSPSRSTLSTRRPSLGRTTTSTATTAALLDPDTPSTDPAQSIYTTLLALYLSPPPPEAQNLQAALDLVSRHGARLPALNTISILPASLPIQELSSYFLHRMRSANSIAREEAIVAALAAVDKSDWDAALMLGEEPGGFDVETTLGEREKAAGRGRMRRVIVDERRVCGVCGKRFGRAAVRVWPNGEVVHYGCDNRGTEGMNTGVGIGVGG